MRRCIVGAGYAGEFAHNGIVRVGESIGVGVAIVFLGITHGRVVPVVDEVTRFVHDAHLGGEDVGEIHVELCPSLEEGFEKDVEREPTVAVLDGDDVSAGKVLGSRLEDVEVAVAQIEGLKDEVDTFMMRECVLRICAWRRRQKCVSA